MAPDDAAIEAKAREIAGQHYAYHFDRPEENPIVAANIEARWGDFVEEAKTAIEDAARAEKGDEKKAK